MQDYLAEKYGHAVCDYFVTSECRTRNKKVGRSSEGIYCHHMDEDKGVNLSNPLQAKLQPFEWQKKERLIYCNALEHLILHMKIAILRQSKKLSAPMDVARFFTTGGVYMICQEINDIFIYDGTSIAWKQRCYEEFRENYEDYIQLVRAFMLYVEKMYRGKKSNDIFLKTGSYVQFSNCSCEILELSQKKDTFVLRMLNGEKREIPTMFACNQLTYADYMERAFRSMASGVKSFYEQIYDDFTNCQITDIVNTYAVALKVDFSKKEFLWGISKFKRSNLTDLS